MKRTLVATSTACLLISFPELRPAIAEDDFDDARVTDRNVEEIIVTGSRIKRRDFFTPSPLMTVPIEEIEFNGQWTLEETLNQMPQVTPDFGRASNNPGIGAATVALRNMGPGRTLVLLNGRRVAPGGERSATDINNIPQALVERVEIITGGTSAVYGSDALAGVVNFITKDRYTGFAVDMSGSVTELGDAESYDFNVTYGRDFADGRGNIAVYGGLLQRKESFADSREFTKYAWLEDYEGNLVKGGSPGVPATQILWPPFAWPDNPDDPNAEFPTTTFEPNGDPREFIWPDDLYNYAPANYLQVPLDRQAFGLMGKYRVSGNLETYLEASYTRNKPAQELAPTPAFGWVAVNLDNPLLTPAARDLFTSEFACDVNLACIFIGRRFVETGPRIADTESDYYRVTSGLRGEFGGDWEFDAWVNYTRSSRMELLRNDVSRSRLQQALLVDPLTGECTDPTGGCVPVDIFGAGSVTSEAADFIRYPAFKNPTTRTHMLAAVVVSGSPLTMTAGDLEIATGLEWRSDESLFLTDEALFSGDIFGWNAQSPGGGHDAVAEIYGEAVVPIVSDRRWAEYLGLEIGARYSDYKYAGGVWSYKAGLEWQLSEAIRLRAMRQRSVRAPNSFELFEEQRSSIRTPFGDQDPCSASEDPLAIDWRSGSPSRLDKCVMQGIPEDQVGTWQATDQYPLEWVDGGNPNLEPEVGRTLTLGAVLTPSWARDWLFAIDYYELEVTGAIGGINSKSVCFDDINVGGAFCDRITRDQTWHMVKVVSITGNKGLMSTRGFDAQASYSGDLPDALAIRDHSATLGASVIWTHLLSFRDQESPATGIAECAGYFGGDCQTSELGNWGGSDTTYTKDRIRMSLHYASGPFRTHLSWRWIRGSRNYWWYTQEHDPGEDIVVKSLPDKQYVDIGFGFDFSEHVSANLGVNNVFETAPPQMADNTWDNNTDTGFYDVFGRSYYLTLSMRY